MEGINILAGVGVPVPVPQDVLRALERVEIVTAIGERGSFQLSFRLDRNATLHEQFLLDSAALIRVVIGTTAGGTRPVAIDGVMVAHAVSKWGDHAVLTIDGEDLTVLMDLDETVVRTFSGMPVDARVLTVLAAYGPFGVIANVIPPPITDLVLPAERVFHQQESDYAFVRRMAGQVGYRFTLDAGPTPGTSVAYWGPEPNAARPRPSLVIDVTDEDPETLHLRFDALQRVTPAASILDPISKVSIPVPVPDISAISPPLGAVVPPAHRRQRIHSAARLTAAEAAGALLAAAARSAEATTGAGTRVIDDGRLRVRAGDVVDVKGVPRPFAGLFTVSRTHDTVTAHRHVQQFQLVRAGVGPPRH